MRFKCGGKARTQARMPRCDRDEIQGRKTVSTHHSKAAPGVFVELESVDCHRLYLRTMLRYRALHLEMHMSAFRRHRVSLGGGHEARRVIDEEIEWQHGAYGAEKLRQAASDDNAFASGGFGRNFCSGEVGVGDAKHVTVAH